MNRLSGKVAIVTGGSKGIGLACAQRMAEEGAAVAIFARDERDGAKAARSLCDMGLRVTFLPVDVTDQTGMRDAIDAVVRDFGRLDVLVNNAGISGPMKQTHETDEDEWDHVHAVNVKGVFFGTKHAIAHMRNAGGGSIVNISSVAGLIGIGGFAPYHASKGAVRLMSKNDAVTYAAQNIRVNSVYPSYVWTPMVEHNLQEVGGDLDAAMQAAAAMHPLGRMGQADDVAWAVVYLASDEARFITGAELAIDGGYTAR